MKYSKGNTPESKISCDIRNFPEDNSWIEAVVFIKLCSQRKKIVAILPKKFLIGMKTLSLSDYLVVLIHITLLVAKTKLTRSEMSRTSWD